MATKGASEVHVGLTGPVMSGKSNLFVDIERCIDLGFHGFPHWRRLAIETDRNYRALIRQNHGSIPASTRTATDIRFDLKFRADPHSAIEESLVVHVRDAPGEAMFPRSSAARQVQSDKDRLGSLNEQKERLDEWFAKAAGIVLVVSVLGAGAYSGFAELVGKVEDFFQKAGEPEFEKLERVVVAISMFDLLMLRFGPRALDVATDPEAVLAILNAHMRPAFDVLKDFRPFGQAGRRIDLRFLATSSFGFHTAFGCPNVETANTKFDPKEEQYPEPLHPEKRRYPYMTADPFVFAAVGMNSPFLFTRDEILSGEISRSRAA